MQAILGHRYGYQSPPTCIPESEMATLMEIAQSRCIPNTENISEWYELDENMIPPTYVLRVIISFLFRLVLNLLYTCL